MNEAVVDELFEFLRHGQIEEASALIHAHPEDISPALIELVREIESAMKLNGEWED